MPKAKKKKTTTRKIKNNSLDQFQKTQLVDSKLKKQMTYHRIKNHRNFFR